MCAKQPMTMLAQGDYRPDFIALRTVPVKLVNGNCSLRVNALLDDSSTKTYVNADVADALGFYGKTEKITINVLNGQEKTLETMPIDVKLESVDGSESIKVTAFTADRVTGNMEVVDWNKYKEKWSHLATIDFPQPAKKPIIDVLIGVDCVEFHTAVQEIRGCQGEPIARLTPLGWTCIGNPGFNKTKLQSHFACTYFTRGDMKIDMNAGSRLRKFRDTQNTNLSKANKIVRFKEPGVSLNIGLVRRKIQTYRNSISQNHWYLRRGTSHNLSSHAFEFRHALFVRKTPLFKGQVASHHRAEKNQYTVPITPECPVSLGHTYESAPYINGKLAALRGDRVL